MGRRYWDNREETKAVKKALKEAGVSFKSIGHDRGTAAGWLEVNLGIQNDKHWKNVGGKVIIMTLEEAGKADRYYPCVGNCPACEGYRNLLNRVTQICQDATGRGGEYHGQISILTQ